MSAADFIGSTILVTIHDPPGQVRGVVADIVGQQVRLENVLWLPTNEYLSIYAIESDNIVDLEVLPEEVPPSFVIVSEDQPAVSTQSSSLEETRNASADFPEHDGRQGTSAEAVREVSAPRSAVSAISVTSISDPSIISTKRPTSKTGRHENTTRPIASNSGVPSLVVSGTLGDDVRVTLSPTYTDSYSKRTPKIPLGEFGGSTKEGNTSRKESLATATLLEPFDNLTLSARFPDTEETKTPDLGGLGIEHVEEPEVTKRNWKRRNRGPKAGRFANGGAQAPTGTSPTENQDLSPTANRAQKRTPASRRRRQQSIAEVGSVNDSPTVPRRTVLSVSRGKGPGNRQTRHDQLRVNDANGWATEDATDIQEMGDFDFEANLSKFDKHKVFTQFRTDDTTADEARLVHHNRLPQKPGTAGGKNLHFTENVLSPKANGFTKWTSEAGESENEDISEARISSGRSSRRNTSRMAIRKPPSRKGSAITPQEPFRISTAPIGSLRYSFEHAGSPKPKRSSTLHTGSLSNSKPCLLIIPSNEPCPHLTPLQLNEIEQIVISDLGVTEEMITENAARGIAETAIRALRSIDSDNENRKNVPDLLISLLTGNHKTGARTLAAARHLCNHGYRVNACILGGEREDNLLDSVRQQAYAFSKSGGTILEPNLFLDGLKGGQIAPSLVIEALLGVHLTFEDLRRDDQGVCYELLSWVRKNKVDVLCIDVPSGTGPTTGEVLQVNNKPLSLFPSTVLSLGAPKPWLLAFLADNPSHNDIELYLADIAISKLAWRRLGNRRNRGIDFAGEWLVKLRYQSGSSE